MHSNKHFKGVSPYVSDWYLDETQPLFHLIRCISRFKSCFVFSAGHYLSYLLIYIISLHRCLAVSPSVIVFSCFVYFCVLKVLDTYKIFNLSCLGELHWNWLCFFFLGYVWTLLSRNYSLKKQTEVSTKAPRISTVSSWKWIHFIICLLLETSKSLSTFKLLPVNNANLIHVRC